MTEEEGKSILISYGLTKLSIKEKEEVLKALADKALEAVKLFQHGEDAPVELSEIGKFIVSKTKKWKYSHTYYEKEAELKLLKSEEEAKGVATFEEIDCLKFNQLRKENHGES
jgi:hypothetical protein